MTHLFQNLNLRSSWTAVLTLLLWGTSSVQAQNRLSLQADAGLSIASLKMTVLGIENEELHRLNGLQGRILTEYAFTENLSLRSGLAYVQLGAEQMHEDHHDQIRIHGLEIPLGFNYRLPVGSGSLGVSAGPALTYHLAAKAHSHENGIEEESELTVGNGVNDFMKPWNLNLQAELSYTHRSGLLLNLRYNAGLLDLGTSDLVQMQTSYLALGLGYRLF
ncbi:MAG: porin family protein [Bacteroidota bacterium]